MKKKLLIPILIICAVFIAGIAAGAFAISYSSVGISTGVCLVSDNGSVFLVDKNSPVRLSDFSDADRLSGLETGDRLLVVHDGIAESYPASTGLIFYVRLARGKEAEIPDTVIASLKELGWIGESEAPSSSDIGFRADIVRTELPRNSREEKISFPVLTLISSPEELLSYCEDFDKWGLNEEFMKRAEKYDESFFEERDILLCLLEEGSGSISHRVTGVKKTDEEFIDIYVETESPEAGTCDMAYHHIFVEVSKSDTGNTRLRLFVDGQERTGGTRTVSVVRDFAGISLQLPRDWDYELTEDQQAPGFSVTIYHKAVPEESIVLEFQTAFGVCGTGLRTEQVEINGYSASMGIYDGNPTFDYISFENTPGFYVLYNYADALWWREYEDEVRGILATLEIAQGIIFREEALEIASENATGEYKRQYSEFDCETGTWTFTFEKNETSEVILVDYSGALVKKGGTE